MDIIKEVETEDSTIERSIVIGMVVSSEFLKRVQPIYHAKYMLVDFTRTVAEWCLQYWEEFSKAPGVDIQDIFNSKLRNKELSHTDGKTISQFLESISEQHERADKFNVDYLLKQTEQHFESVSQMQLAEDLKHAAITGQVLAGRAMLARHSAVELPSAMGINPFTSMKSIKATFAQAETPLFTFPGALGQLINSQLTRDAFIGILGQEKIGKTWWLMEYAIRAARNQCNVAFFQCGDLSQKQQHMRMMIRIAGRSNKEKYCGEIMHPILDCKHNQDNVCIKSERENNIGVDWNEEEGIRYNFDNNKEYTPCTICIKNRDFRAFKGVVWYKMQVVDKPLDWKTGFKLGKRFDKLQGQGKSFKLYSCAASTLNVNGLENILDIWEREEQFVPDVICIDYADIMAKDNPGDEFRHSENERWKLLRKLSIQRNCLVITCTQADADSYGKRSLKLKNFSECKGKYSHTTCFISLNQLPEEKKGGIIRIANLIVREDDFDINKEVKILQCLKIGRPYLGSYF